MKYLIISILLLCSVSYAGIDTLRALPKYQSIDTEEDSSYYMTIYRAKPFSVLGNKFKYEGNKYYYEGKILYDDVLRDMIDKWTKNGLNDTLVIKTSTIDSLKSKILASQASITLISSGLDSLAAAVILKANVSTTDSLRGRISTAEGSISTNSSNISYMNGQITNLQSQVNLKANATTTDSLRGRMNSAEGSISINTSNISAMNGLITTLQSNITLKANVTTVDSLLNRMGTAESGISLNASNISGLQSNILLYAKKDSIISKINISPESIKINTDKLNVYGIIKAFNGTGDSTVVDGSKIKTGTLTVDKLIEISSTSGGKKATLTGGGLQFSNGAFNIQLDNNGSAAQFSNDLQVVGNLDVEYDITASNITVNPEAYGSGWNADQTVATKQDIYNKIQTLQAADSDLDDLADGTLTGSKVGTGINWNNITVNKPNTLLGYGINDTYYGSAIATKLYVSPTSGGSATTELSIYPIYIGGTLHYLPVY